MYMYGQQEKGLFHFFLIGPQTQDSVLFLEKKKIIQADWFCAIDFLLACPMKSIDGKYLTDVTPFQLHMARRPYFKFQPSKSR